MLFALASFSPAWLIHLKLTSSENFRWYGMVLGLAAILALLAVLQYRSSKAVAEATTDQMRSSLQGSLMDVRQGLERELAPLCRELQRIGHCPSECLARLPDKD